MNDELERLIKEQRRDAKYGNRIYNEHAVVMHLEQQGSAVSDYELKDYLSNEGMIFPHRVRTKGCVIHGLKEWKQSPEGYVYCQRCHAERQYVRYHTDPVYREKKLSYSRERYANDPEWREKRKQKSKDYIARMRKDPAWIARENERQRRQRAKRKHYG